MERPKFRWALVKLILFGLFLINLGIIQVFQVAIERNQNNPFNKLSKEEQNRRRGTVELLSSERFRQVQELVDKGGVYTPSDFYDDLFQFEKTFRELGIRGPVGLYETQLRAMAWRGREHGYTIEDFNRAVGEFHERCFRELGIENPGLKPRKNIEIDWHKTLKWLVKFYLLNLPLALILYIVWLIQGSHEWLLIPRLFRFAWLLLIYPITIFRVVRMNTVGILSEAQIRRDKADIFAPLSEAETARLKEVIGKSLSFAQWRRQLAELGFKPRHSFVAALLVTLMFVIVIRPLEAGAKEVKDFAGNLVLEQIATSQNLARMSIEDAEKIQPEKCSSPSPRTGDALAADRCECAFFLRCCYFTQKNILALMAEFFREIFHIPLQAVEFEANIESKPQF